MMLDALTAAESDRLWWRLVRAMAAVADEMECLMLAPAHVRDQLYGPGVLQSYRGLLDDLAAITDDDMDTPAASWTDLLTANPEEGTPQWHDSDALEIRSKMTYMRLAARISLARALRRLAPPKWTAIHPR